MSDGIGYVLCGYLDSEGPEGITADGQVFTGKPYPSVEAAWDAVEALGGPAEDATVIVGRVVPVGLIAPAFASEQTLIDRVHEAEAHFGRFESNEDFIEDTESYDLSMELLELEVPINE